MTPTVEWILAAAGVCTAIGVLVYPARVGGRLFKSAENFFEDWNGAPARPGMPARPPFPERMAVVEATTGLLAAEVASVRAELRPNGGATIRDAVDRIEAGRAGEGE